MEEQNEYLLLIKNRLIEYVKNSDKSLNSIYNACNKDAKDNDIISYPTIYHLIKGDKLPNNLTHIKLIADALGLDLGLLLSADPGIRINSIPITGNNTSLDNEQYIHDYHVYTYPNGNSKDILHGRLNITKDKNTTIANLEIEMSVQYIDGTVIKKVDHYVGTPVYNKTHNTVYMFLQSSKGDFYFISFYYKMYNSQNMYYRKASCVCINSITKSPMIKNMVILGNEADDEFIKKYIPGLLKLEERTFYISKNTLETLMEDPSIKQTVDQYQNDIGNTIEMYQINPNKLLSNFELYEKDELREMQKFISFLQAHSISLDKCVYSGNETEAIMIKHPSKN